MKKLLCTVATMGTSVLAFADGGTTSGGTGTSNGIADVADVSGIFTAAQSNLAALIDAALPVAIAFVGGGLVIWGAIALVSILKRAFGAGKGR